MPTILLNETAVINLDGSGNGKARTGPLGPREIWSPLGAHVQVATAVKEAKCDVFVGSDATQGNYRDTTLSGSTGDSTGRVSGDEIRTGSYVWAVWSGGDANQQATLNVVGLKVV